MALTINTNVASLNAQRNLSKSQGALNKSMERLSSGMRINSAKDDAAGLAISNRMTSQINGLNQSIRNSNDGISLAQTAEGALGEMTNIGQRMRELAVQSKNATNTDTDRQSLNQEFQDLQSEMDRIAQQTSFNGKNVLDGSMGSARFQVGANVGETIAVDMTSSMRGSEIGKYASKTYTLANDAVATAGDTVNVMSADGDLKINGTSIAAATTGTAGDGQGSALKIAEAINKTTATHGVTATAGETEVTVTDAELKAFAFNDKATDDDLTYELKINGQSILTQGEADAVKDVSELANAINTKSTETGVVAKVGDDGSMTLKAADGRNIEVEEILAGGTATETDEVTGYFGNKLTEAAGGTITNFDITKADLSLSGGGNIKLEFTTANKTDELFSLTGIASDETAAQALDNSDILSAENADLAINRIDQALQDMDVFRGKLGSAQSRFESTIANTMNVSENLSAARSRIMDADIASETAAMTRNNILQQAGVSILAQANQAPNVALSLLG